MDGDKKPSLSQKSGTYSDSLRSAAGVLMLIAFTTFIASTTFALLSFSAVPATATSQGQTQTQTAEQPDPFYLDLLRDGKYFYDTGDYDQAIENFKIAFFGFLDNPPKLTECYLYLSICLYQIKDLEQAKHYYDEIKRLNLEEHLQEIDSPQSVLDKYYEIDAHFSRLEASSSSPLSPSRLSASSPEAEIDRLKDAIKNNRQNYDAYLRLETIYLQQNKTKEAKSILKDLLKVDPRNGNAYFELGKILAAEKKYEEALQKFRQASSLLPDNIDLHYEKARTHYELKNYNQATQEFAKVQAVNENYKDTEKYLGAIEEAERRESKRTDLFLDLARKEKNLSTKIMYYKQALRNDPSNQEIYFEMSRTYQAEEKYDDAADVLEPLLEKSPEKTEIHLELAEIYLKDRSYNKVISILKRALAVAPETIEISYLLGRAYMGKNRYEEAADAFHQVLKKDPGYKNTRQLLQRCLQKIK